MFKKGFMDITYHFLSKIMLMRLILLWWPRATLVSPSHILGDCVDWMDVGCQSHPFMRSLYGFTHHGASLR